MPAQKKGWGQLFTIFAILSLACGFIILRLSFIAGGIYATMIGATEYTDFTEEIVATVNLIIFVVYEIIVIGLVLYTAQKKKISWFSFFLFAVTPLAIFLLKGSIYPRLGAFFLHIIASLAVYQVLVIRYRRRHRTGIQN